MNVKKESEWEEKSEDDTNFVFRDPVDIENCYCEEMDLQRHIESIWKMTDVGVDIKPKVEAKVINKEKIDESIEIIDEEKTEKHNRIQSQQANKEPCEVNNKNESIVETQHKGEKQYSCYLCDKKFQTNFKLKSHICIHTGEKPYSCSYCPEKFRVRETLNSHKRKHTGASLSKKFSCDLCDKKFLSNFKLKLHQHHHTGEKPLQCTFCPKKFAAQSYQHSTYS